MRQQRAALARCTTAEATEQGECWPWPGPRNAKGYGIVAPSLAASTSRLATRTVLTLVGQPVGPGQVALHHCDNPPCVRPSHLYVGTPATNSADMVRRGRSSRKPSRRKLTDAEVVEVRRRRAAGEKLVTIAAAVGLHPSHVSRIVNHRRRQTA